MKAFILLLGLGTFLAVMGMALVVNAMVDKPSGYTVFLHNCDEPTAMLGEHVASFAVLDEARTWADSMLAIRYDVAMIYVLDAPSRLTDLLWVRSDGACYEDYREWRKP